VVILKANTLWAIKTWQFAFVHIYTDY